MMNSPLAFRHLVPIIFLLVSTFFLSSSSARIYDLGKGAVLFVPDDCQVHERLPLMVAFHPLGTPHWHARSWLQSLLPFAEQQRMMLLCPDGGSDGRLTDPADLAEALRLIDRCTQQFPVHPQQVYALGYGWGARAALELSLAQPGCFQGTILVGAAIDGMGDFMRWQAGAPANAYYLLQGEWDAPSRRLVPLVESLRHWRARVGHELIPKVGHTWEFSGRQQALTRALHWLQKQHLSPHLIQARVSASFAAMSPEPSLPFAVARNGKVWLEPYQKLGQLEEVRIFDHEGLLIRAIAPFNAREPILNLAPGRYRLHLRTSYGQFSCNVTLLASLQANRETWPPRQTSR